MKGCRWLHAIGIIESKLGACCKARVEGNRVSSE